MKKRLANLKKGIEQYISKGAKVKFTSCGDVLIDNLTYTFSVMSDGKESDKGMIVSISGEAIEEDILKFSTIEMIRGAGQKKIVQTKKFERVTKKDGRYIYKAEFSDVYLGGQESKKGKSQEEIMLTDLASQYIFRIVPEFKCDEEKEVMITVYPVENPLEGLAVEWRKCTSDKDWFKHNFSKLKKRKERKI